MTDTVAHARATDIDTSHHAAAKVRKVTTKQDAVLATLTLIQADPNLPEFNDGMTHTDLIRWYHHASRRRPEQFPPQTDQSIRSRCAELVAQGRVKDTGQRVLLEGSRNRSAVWSVVL